MTGAVERVRAEVQRAVDGRVFPAAVAEVGNDCGVIWRQAFGSLTFDATAGVVGDDTIFDLASLTKPLATTSLVLKLVGDGQLGLADSVESFFEEWRGQDRDSVTIQDLLEHASGLPARLVDRSPASRREFTHEICSLQLEYPPRSRSLYSDLGFILLGFLAEDRGGDRLDGQFDRIVGQLTAGLAFRPPPEMRSQVAPTAPEADDHRYGRLLVGEVHDSYAAALGGVAGHAGLFGTAAGVGEFARTVLRASRGHADSVSSLYPHLVSVATRKSQVPHSSRALGWDTMLPTSSCGVRMTPAAFGHVGYTGTSLWIDPGLDRYFVLLTNRACQGGTLEEMRQARRRFHDAATNL